MDKTPAYTEDNTRDPRNPPLKPRDAEKLSEAASKKNEQADAQD